MNEFYLSASPEAGKAFYQAFSGKGPIVMLNLMRFREVANYQGVEHLQPENPISGQEAYEAYMEHTVPHLLEAGSEVLFNGQGGDYLIGPLGQGWDRVLLVRHQSVEKFMAFAQNPDYLHTAGHRTAALEDSRLLPMLP